MKNLLITVFAFLVLAVSSATAQEVSPFKLGLFEQGDRVFVGVVIDESMVIDLSVASAAIGTPAASEPMPRDMKELIERYDSGVRQRIVEILRNTGDLPQGARPDWVYDIDTLKILPPIMYPMTMMNVAVNYAEHDVEMAAVRQGAPGQTMPTGGNALPGTESASGIWERRPNDPRWNPYMFLKATASIIAHGEPIRIPPGRSRIEWECELAVVIGQTASRVPVERAEEYIFGYTLQNDISDRGGRGDTRYGSDWLVTKSQDTFAPIGPFITPKEFVPDVHQLRVTYALNDEILQEGSTAQMIHGVPELVTYGSNLLTLRPGDLIATGTPPGSGSARTPPIFLQDGDVSVCHYEGVGTLVNPVERSASD